MPTSDCSAVNISKLVLLCAAIALSLVCLFSIYWRRARWTQALRLGIMVLLANLIYTVGHAGWIIQACIDKDGVATPGFRCPLELFSTGAGFYGIFYTETILIACTLYLVRVSRITMPWRLELGVGIFIALAIFLTSIATWAVCHSCAAGLVDESDPDEVAAKFTPCRRQHWAVLHWVWLGFQALPFTLFAFLVREVNFAQAHAAAPPDYPMSKVERINRNRLVTLRKQAISEVFRPLWPFPVSFIIFVLAVLGHELWKSSAWDTVFALKSLISTVLFLVYIPGVSEATRDTLTCAPKRGRVRTVRVATRENITHTLEEVLLPREEERAERAEAEIAEAEIAEAEANAEGIELNAAVEVTRYGEGRETSGGSDSYAPPKLVSPRPRLATKAPARLNVALPGMKEEGKEEEEEV